jgi:hypothetical protein
LTTAGTRRTRLRPETGLQFVIRLQGDGDREPDARIPTVVKIVPVVIVDVNVIGAVPVFCPVFRPGIHKHERKAAVREARIPHIHRGAAVHPEPVLTTEIEAEAVLRNVVAAIASALRPGAMLAFPALSTTLLPSAVALPAALLHPSSLLLPRDCLLLGTARLLLLPGLLGMLFLLLSLPLLLSLSDLRLRLLLLRLLLLRLLLWLGLLSLLLPGELDTLSLLLLLLGTLRLLWLLGLLGTLFYLVRRPLLLSLLGSLLRLLSGHSAPLLRLVPRLLSARFGSLRLSLRTRLLCRLRRGLLLSVRLPFGLALFFILLLVLRVRRDQRSDKQKQSCGAKNSMELHRHVLPGTSLSGHARGRPARLYRCSSASAASASALVLCTVPSGWLGGEYSVYSFNGTVFVGLITLWYVPAGTTTASPSRTARSRFSLKTNLASPCSIRKNRSTSGCTSSPISSPGPQTYHYKPGVPSREQHLAEVPILQRLFFNRFDVFNHETAPICHSRERRIPLPVGKALHPDP